MSEYVFTDNPYGNGWMLTGELNSYCEKCKKKNRDDNNGSLMYSYKNIEDKNKNETLDMYPLKTKASEITSCDLSSFTKTLSIEFDVKDDESIEEGLKRFFRNYIKDSLKWCYENKRHFEYLTFDFDYPTFKELRKKYLNGDETMPNITDYTYNPETGTTTIIWDDNTTTTVTAEDPATADQYTGFMIAYAKKAAGNTSRIQSIYERALKLPEKKVLAEQKAKEKEEEQKKIRENQKARKRRQRVRREARRRKEEYEKSLIREEAKRLAEKEYGVPYDNNDWLNTGEDKGHETT